jgi:myo-inositol 2-dehydrogenase/D-chiro-inositol 1-dehydrogenase
MAIRLAVIGAGIMGADHARIVAEDLPGAVLQVVCDMDAGRARAVADRTGAADAATDPLATIARADVDAVIVASPDATHTPLSLACLAAGKRVLCEKPLSQASAECLQVIDAEVAAGRQWVQVGFMRRYDQSYVEMKAALDSGALGRAMMMHNFHRNVSVPDWFTADMAITNSAPHEFDIGRHLLGAEYAAIAAFSPKGPGGKVGPVLMVIETEAGQLMNIEVNNNATYGYDVRGELVGETASVSMQTPLSSRLDGALRSATAYAPDWRDRFADAYRRQAKAFLGFVETGDFPAIAANAWDGYCASAVAEAGVRALAEGRRVTLDLAAKPALYR